MPNNGLKGFPDPDVESNVQPVNPTSWDDEFDSPTLNPKWTVVNQVAGENLTLLDSQLRMYAPYLTQRVWGIKQAISGNWRVRAKLWYEGPTLPYYGVGLWVGHTTTTPREIWSGIVKHTTQGQIAAYIQRTANLAFSTDALLGSFERQPIYLEMEYDGTYIIWRSSSSGVTYHTYWNETVASWVGVPEYLGLNVHPYANAAGYAGTFAVDWFRRMA
jgi:hypothetical protein